MLEDDQVGHRANETDLANLLLETQEEHDPVVLVDVDLATEITAQIALVVAAQPAQVAVAMRGNAVIQTIEDRPLFFLHQK
ncbi:hypothetical protein D3C84_1143710 [compost metagenome]